MIKILRLWSFVALFSVAAVSTSVSAATVIDFGTGLAGPGGTITNNGTHTAGSDILIGALSVSGAPANNGVYVTDAVLDFDTGIASNFITIVVSVPDLNIGAGTVLLTGSFDLSTTSYQAIPTAGGVTEIFSGGGPDTKACALLCALQVPLGTPFEFFGFTIESVNGVVVSTDIVNTAVPVPAAVWLFGSGLLGLVGVARRRA